MYLDVLSAPRVWIRSALATVVEQVTATFVVEAAGATTLRESILINQTTHKLVLLRCYPTQRAAPNLSLTVRNCMVPSLVLASFARYNFSSTKCLLSARTQWPATTAAVVEKMATSAPESTSLSQRATFSVSMQVKLRLQVEVAGTKFDIST